ncbi:MAG: AAA family ATPase, partial [Jatrophihabitans sp.]|uniref:AAA family ATPase n=1 Tax=Jatrophihabitans sp. TaxID=1932789 RepID=UPI003F80D493
AAAVAHRRRAAGPTEVWVCRAVTGLLGRDRRPPRHGHSPRRYRADLLERFRLDPTVRMRAASHGNRQKVLLVAAFASRAELLLLDEPTTGLDPLMAQVFRECVREAKQRGQTVLLSSHVLAEVEAVCDRVSMLRAGRLLEIGSLDRLRAMASVHVRIVVAGAVPDLRQIAGVQRLHVDGHVVECDLTGSMAPLLSALAGCTVLELRTHEPSLEELFLAEYGADRP